MFQRVYESIREGDTIAEPLKESRLVDDMVVNMVDVGEETGDLDTMLYKIADFYDEEVERAGQEPDQPAGADHDRRSSAFIIGTIVIALFLPLIELLEGSEQVAGDKCEGSRDEPTEACSSRGRPAGADIRSCHQETGHATLRCSVTAPAGASR